MSKPYAITDDLLYADDTMLVAAKQDALQQHLDTLVEIAQPFGLELTVSKTILLGVRSDANVAGSERGLIRCKEEA
eukprot:4273957-Pyramimonas_sp.AAC.1